MLLFSAPVWPAQSETLEAKKMKPGKSFEARTAEALKASDGSLIRAGAKPKGPVSHATDTGTAQRNAP